ncbi:MAG: hypothetical protein H6826_14360 [Planctomycetes bacterium]|nr:hypothetical protein [Planctomycetota bacterium]
MPFTDEDRAELKTIWGQAFAAALKHEDFASAIKAGVAAVLKDNPQGVSKEDVAAMIAEAVKSAPKPEPKGKEGDPENTAPVTAEKVAEIVAEALKKQAADASKDAETRAANKKATVAWLAARGLDKKIVGSPLEKRFDGCADDDARQAALDALNEDLKAAGAPAIEAKEKKPEPLFAPGKGGGDETDPSKVRAIDDIKGGIGEILPDPDRGGGKDSKGDA